MHILWDPGFHNQNELRLGTSCGERYGRLKCMVFMAFKAAT